MDLFFLLGGMVVVFFAIYIPAMAIATRFDALETLIEGLLEELGYERLPAKLEQARWVKKGQ